MATVVSRHPSVQLPNPQLSPRCCSAQLICTGSGQGLTEVREGARLQGIRSLSARLHFQPASCLFSRLNHEGRFGIRSLSCTGLLEKERSIYTLQSSILTIRSKLQIYLPDLDQGWGFLCLLFRLLSLWKAGGVAMLGGGLAAQAAWERRCNAKELVQNGSAGNVSPGSDFFSNPGS